MTDLHENHATDTELSAYLDAELPGPASQRIAAHLAVCPRCAGRVADFAALSADFAQWPADGPGYDLGTVILERLPVSSVRGAGSGRRRLGWRSLLPVGLGAMASVVLGIAIGLALFGGVPAQPGMTAMNVFDPIPPGGLCLGVEGCQAARADMTGMTGVIK